jgi:hypothetical protein
MVIQIARAPSGVSVWEIPQHRLQSQIMLQRREDELAKPATSTRFAAHAGALLEARNAA